MNIISTDKLLNSKAAKPSQRLNPKLGETDVFMISDIANAKDSNLPHSPHQEDKFIWTKELDDLIEHLALKYRHDWKKISRRVYYLKGETFSPFSLQSRYKTMKTFPSKSKRNYFRTDEDELLMSLYTIHQTNWSIIANFFPERSPVSLKNRYYYLIRLNQVEEAKKISFEEKQGKTRSHSEWNFQNKGMKDYDMNTLVKDLSFEENPKWLEFLLTLV